MKMFTDGDIDKMLERLTAIYILGVDHITDKESIDLFADNMNGLAMKIGGAVGSNNVKTAVNTYLKGRNEEQIWKI